MKNDDTLKIVNDCVTLVLSWAAETSVELGSSIELFVEPLGGTGSCGYYLVDHGSRVLFWLQDCSTSDLNLPDACSIQNMSA